MIPQLFSVPFKEELLTAMLLGANLLCHYSPSQIKEGKQRNPRRQPYQIVIWTNPKEFSEVPKSHRCIGLEPEVCVVVSRGEVTSFTAENRRYMSRASVAPSVRPRQGYCVFKMN